MVPGTDRGRLLELVLVPVADQARALLRAVRPRRSAGRAAGVAPPDIGDAAGLERALDHELLARPAAGRALALPAGREVEQNRAASGDAVAAQPLVGRT